MSCSELDSTSSLDEDWYDFNEAEKRLLKRSWKTLQREVQTISCNIYTMIFNQCPEARRLFPFMRLPSNNNEKKSKEFVFQALRFIQVLESGINSLDNLEAFDPILDNLGRRHGKLESSCGFRPYYWSVFLECTIHHIRLALINSKEDHWNSKDADNAIILWRHLVSGICRRIKKGYMIDTANRSHSKEVQEVAVIKNLPTVVPSIPKLSTETSGTLRRNNQSDRITD